MRIWRRRCAVRLWKFEPARLKSCPEPLLMAILAQAEQAALDGKLHIEVAPPVALASPLVVTKLRSHGFQVEVIQGSFCISWEWTTDEPLPA